MVAGRDIPDAIERQLRQEAGFGCCVCGSPILEYHHIVPFAVNSIHDPVNMMILCPNHHYMATVGALSEMELRTYKARAFNIFMGFAHGQLVIQHGDLIVEIGTIRFVGPGFKITVDEEPLVKIERDSVGRVLLSLRLYDESDNPTLKLEDNEWIAGDPLPWDIESGFGSLKIRRAKGDVVLELDVRVSPILLTAELWRKGHHFSASKQELVYDGIVKNWTFKEFSMRGVGIGVDTTRGVFYFD